MREMRKLRTATRQGRWATRARTGEVLLLDRVPATASRCGAPAPRWSAPGLSVALEHGLRTVPLLREDEQGCAVRIAGRARAAPAVEVGRLQLLPTVADAHAALAGAAQAHPAVSAAGRPVITLPGRPAWLIAGWLSVLVDGLEVVVEGPGGELIAHVPGGGVGGAEVDPLPHPGVDDVLEQCVAAVVV